MRRIRTRVGSVSPLAPNWSSPVHVEHEYLTEVRTSRSGLEQREANRATARMAVNMSVAVAADLLARLRQDLDADQNAPTAVRLPWRRADVASDALSGALGLELTEAPFWAVSGALAVVTTSTAEFLVTVESLVGTTLTVAAPLPVAVAAGARVEHALACWYPESLTFTAATSGVWTTAARMEAVPGVYPQPVAPATTTIYAGAEVFLHKPNWATRPTLTLERQREDVDFSYGRAGVFSPTTFGVTTLLTQHTTKTAEEAEELISFFHRQKGRRGAFWAPTWLEDLRSAILNPITSDDLTVAGLDAFTAYSTSPVHRRIIAFWPDGSYQINAVSAVAVSGGRTVFDMAANWEERIDPSTRLHWLLPMRFGSDTLTVDFLTTQAARVQMNFVTLTVAEVAA